MHFSWVAAQAADPVIQIIKGDKQNIRRFRGSVANAFYRNASGYCCQGSLQKSAAR
jgi:hypothetical protein